MGHLEFWLYSSINIFVFDTLLHVNIVRKTGIKNQERREVIDKRLYISVQYC